MAGSYLKRQADGGNADIEDAWFVLNGDNDVVAVLSTETMADGLLAFLRNATTAAPRQSRVLVACHSDLGYPVLHMCVVRHREDVSPRAIDTAARRSAADAGWREPYVALPQFYYGGDEAQGVAFVTRARVSSNTYGSRWSDMLNALDWDDATVVDLQEKS